MATTIGDKTRTAHNGKGEVSEEAQSPSEIVAAESHEPAAPPAQRVEQPVRIAAHLQDPRWAAILI